MSQYPATIPPVNLILLERGDLNDSGEATLTGARARHAIEVLKAAPGKAVRIGMLNGAVRLRDRNGRHRSHGLVAVRV